MFSVIAATIISFTSTNIDDIFILIMLYSQLNTKMKKNEILLGQYMGFIVLMAITLFGVMGAFYLPQKFIGFFGVIPIILGIKSWIGHKNGNRKTVSKLNKISKDQNNLQNTKFIKNKSKLFKIKEIFSQFIDPEIIDIALITIINGFDNVGIYIPLYSHYSFKNIFISIFVIMLMVALWCFIGYKLVSYPTLKEKIDKYMPIVEPIVFIAIGIFIIIKNTLLI